MSNLRDRLPELLRSQSISEFGAIRFFAADEIERLRIANANLTLESILELAESDPAALEYLRPKLEKLNKLLGV